MVERLERVVDGYSVPPTWVVGARSMLVDRAVPRLEFLWMPQTIQPGGCMALIRDKEGMAPERKRGWKVHAHRIVRKDAGIETCAGPIIDLRINSPENWAHAQIFHLPIAQMAREWVGVTPAVLLTFRTPRYIRTLYEHFGFRVLATERPVKGDIITPDLSSFDVLRPVRRELAKGLIADLDRRRAAGEMPKDLPRKIFVVREKTRRIRNETEIEEHLVAQGYKKVLPEKMSVPAQIELFNQATSIAAIHGAALAPLLFRSPDAPPVELLEILTPGHMATSYRLMVAQVGGHYVGVRGRVKPEMVNPSYNFDGVYKLHSLDDFTVDLESLKAAQAILAEGCPPQIVD